MSVTHDQPLAILITAILVELDVVHYLVFDRCLQQLARSFLEQLFEKRFLFIFSSLIERDHFIFCHWRILSFFLSRLKNISSPTRDGKFSAWSDEAPQIPHCSRHVRDE